MTWKAYAETDTFHRYVDISVGQDLGHSINMVDFPLVSVRTVTRSETLPEAQPLHLNLDAARALYEALDRIFGKHEETGVSDVSEKPSRKSRSESTESSDDSFAPNLSSRRRRTTSRQDLESFLERVEQILRDWEEAKRVHRTS